MFKSPQAHELIKFVRKKYNRELEFLWARSPDDGIWRRADNDKWFGGIFHVRANRIMPNASDEIIEILDIRCTPDMIDFIVDKKMIFPGWHMNKRHWITIILDGRMKMSQIENLLNSSYRIAGEK